MTLATELIDSVGSWAGSNGFRLMPSDPLDEAPATADVWTAAGKGLVGITYTWSHPEDAATVAVPAGPHPAMVTELRRTAATSIG